MKAWRNFGRTFPVSLRLLFPNGFHAWEIIWLACSKLILTGVLLPVFFGKTATAETNLKKEGLQQFLI